MGECIHVAGVSGKVVSADDFNANILLEYDVLTRACKKAKGSKRFYLNVVCSFDIEATNIKEQRQAVMFVWQFQIGHAVTVIGRTWQQFLCMLVKIKKVLKQDQWLLVYVHNLSYEFSFLKGVYSFQPIEVFAVEKREILRCDMLGHIEFRCSYYLSNDSLDHWSKSLKVEHIKQSGEDFDYSILRWPWTELTPDEYRYCVYDVLAVVECVEVMLEARQDTLATIPLTSTGYVRRMVRTEMLELGHWYTKDLRPSYELYQLLRSAFRGGNCHCNRWYSGITVEHVYSADRSSSYPDVLCNCQFPVSKFVRALDRKVDVGALVNDNRAFICEVELKGDIHLINPYWGFPYIPKDKCLLCSGETVDNGRILEADYVKMAVTDVDLRIIFREYTCDEVSVSNLWFSKYGYLPDAFTRTIKKLYVEKSAMKGGAQEDTVEYFLKKGEINACYGMAAQQVLKDDVVFWGDAFYYRSELSDSQLKDLGMENKLPEELYDEQSPLLPYQWACWCTALARAELEDAMWDCVDDNGICRLIYIDTDSLYYESPRIDWSTYNKIRIIRSRKSGTFAQDAAGEMHYMGALEEDPPYDRFRSWGAKKYITDRAGKIKITVSGVKKKEGGKELQEAAEASGMDPFDLFALGFTFVKSAGQAAWYNDEYAGEYMTPDGKSVQLTSNLYLEDTTYTITVGFDYFDIIDTFARRPVFCQKVLDLWQQSAYNTINESKTALKYLKGGQKHEHHHNL